MIFRRLDRQFAAPSIDFQPARNTVDPTSSTATHIGDSLANQALMFGLELTVYGSVIAWAISAAPSPVSRALLAIGAVAGMGTVWGLLAAPRAPVPVHGLARVGLELAWFGVGAGALWFSDHRGIAVAFALLFAVNGGLRAAASAA